MNQSTTLVTIQKFAKAFKIISTIIMVSCIVGCIMSLVGLACLTVIPQAGYVLGKVNIRNIIEASAETPLVMLYALTGAAAIVCAGKAISAGAARKLFKLQLEAGTPFDFAVADEMKRAAFIIIFVPIAAVFLATAVYSGIGAANGYPTPVEFDKYASIGTGIVLLLLSFICRYGAELRSQYEQN